MPLNENHAKPIHNGHLSAELRQFEVFVRNHHNQVQNTVQGSGTENVGDVRAVARAVAARKVSVWKLKGDTTLF